ncbi:MAG: entericidin EcnA/B family protein [Boseongicola sp.]|nr:entericidin EcnA/B family protein [Boseongicola sp.]
MRKAILLAMLLLGLAACNTVEGIGSDVSAGARAIGDVLT